MSSACAPLHRPLMLPCVLQPWQIAMEKTQLASQEVASANLAAESAAGALRRAEQAERVVQTEGAEHDRVSTHSDSRLL